MSIVLKLHYQSSVKRVRDNPKTFGELLELAYNEFEELRGLDLVFQYVDLDKEFINIASDCDLSEAYKYFEENEMKVLKLDLKKSNELLQRQSDIGSLKNVVLEFNNEIQKNELVPKIDAKVKELGHNVLINKEEAKEKVVKNSNPKGGLLVEAKGSLTDLIKTTIDEEIRNSEVEFQSIAKEEITKALQPKPIQKLKTAHLGVKCDSCHAVPIIGVRYKCSECLNYNLCEICEEKEIHPNHNFLKFIKEEKKENVIESKVKGHKSPSKWLDNVKSFFSGSKKIEVDDSMAKIKSNNDLHITAKAKSIIMPRVTFHNNGNKVWPDNCIIDKEDGNIDFEPAIIPGKLGPNMEFSFPIPVECPSLPGDYNLRLRLKVGDKFFGQSIFLNLHIEPPESDDKFEVLNSL